MGPPGHPSVPVPVHKAPKRLKLLYVGTLPPHPGGSAVSCSQLLAGFAEMNYAVRAIAPITPQAYRSGDPFAERHREIEVSRIPVPYFETAPYVPAPEAYRRLEGQLIGGRLEALIKGERPDVVLVGRETFVWHVPDITRAHGLPCVMMVRGSPTVGVLSGRYPAELSRQFLEQCRKVDLIVTVAAHLAEGLRRLGLSKVCTIFNAVDLSDFSPAPKDPGLLRELAIGDDRVVVGYVANLHARKRPLDLVASAARALRHDSRLVYVVVGDGTLRQATEDACRLQQIHHAFRFVGWVDYQRVPALINLADMVVLPSDAEGLARVYLETQACGRLLVASDIPPAREVITDGETGLLFRPGDTEDLASKTLRAASDPDLRARIGRQARERVRLHGVREALSGYAMALQGVIERHRQTADRGVGSDGRPSADN